MPGLEILTRLTTLHLSLVFLCYTTCQKEAENETQQNEKDGDDNENCHTLTSLRRDHFDPGQETVAAVALIDQINGIAGVNLRQRRKAR